MAIEITNYINKSKIDFPPVVSRLKFAVAAPPLAQARSSDMADSVGNLSSNGK